MSDRRMTTLPKVEAPAKPSAENGTGEPDPVLLLLDGWLADESGYDEDAWPELKAALDRDRLSSRKLFDG